MKTEIFYHEILRNSTIFRFLLPRPSQNDLVGLAKGLLTFVRQGFIRLSTGMIMWLGDWWEGVVVWKRQEIVLITKKEGMDMRRAVNTESDLGKLILEGMMTVFIVLMFLFIAQNWVLTNVDDTPFAPTCSLSDGRVGIGGPVPYETNKIMDGYKLILQ
jgi:hypothetical protein